MNIARQLDKLVRGCVETLLAEAGAECSLPTSLIEIPRQKEHGDYAAGIALQLARVLRRKPLDIAGEIAGRLPASEWIDRAEAVPPGFVNLTLGTSACAAILRQIDAERDRFGFSQLGEGKRVLVEFVSANPTGPLHIGHGRNAIVGDAVARVLEAAGYKVEREYYFNDAGVQMRKLGESLRARYLQCLGQDASLPEGGYQGDYLPEIAQRLRAEAGDNCAGEKELNFFIDYAVREILKTIESDLHQLRIDFDHWFSETTLHHDGLVDSTLERLKANGELYLKDSAWWLRTEKYGDEKDRVVIKSDGEKTYLAPDIAYHENKFKRGFDLLVNVLGGDHHGYVPRLLAAVQSLGYDRERLRCIILQMVTLIRGGEKIKLSTRAGEFITLEEMVHDLGPDVVRFFFLTRTTDSQLVFDWDLAKERSMKNPVFYIQYAHARCCSLFKKAAEVGIEWKGVETADLSLLATPEEQNLIKALGRLSEIVEIAAAGIEPCHLTTYLRNTVELFHQFFTMGTRDEDLRFIIPDNPALTQARLSLVLCMQIVLANTLRILGVSAPETM